MLKELYYLRTFNLETFIIVEDMKPGSNQPARLYGTAKTHNLENLKEIAVGNLAFRPITD